MREHEAPPDWALENPPRVHGGDITGTNTVGL